MLLPEAQDKDRIRTYPIQNLANITKLNKIKQVFPFYRALAQKLANLQWRLFFQEHKLFNEFSDVDFVESLLIERYKRCCLQQVVGVLKSYVANLQNAFKERVLKHMFQNIKDINQFRHDLFYINKLKLWFHDKITTDKGREIPFENIKLARSIVRNILNHWKKPSFRKINLDLNYNVAKISEYDKSFGAKIADYWIRVSTLESGHPVYIPLKSNEYFDKQIGKRLNFVRIEEREDLLVFSLFKRKEKKQYIPRIEKIGLDIGLVNLFATNFGDLYGKGLWPVLKELDCQIQKLEKERRSRKLNLDSPRHKKLVKKLRETIKNEINRCLNRIVKDYAPGRIVLENLRFLHPNLSSTMNRLIKKFGLKYIKDKLEMLHEDYGIEIEYVHAAYTSQTCSFCNYTSEKNRKTRNFFACDSCHKNLHADVNGSRNVFARSSCKEFEIYRSRQGILEVLRERFSKKLGEISSRTNSCTVTMPAAYQLASMKELASFSP